MLIIILLIHIFIFLSKPGGNYPSLLSPPGAHGYGYTSPCVRRIGLQARCVQGHKESTYRAPIRCIKKLGEFLHTMVYLKFYVIRSIVCPQIIFIIRAIILTHGVFLVYHLTISNIKLESIYSKEQNMTHEKLDATLKRYLYTVIHAKYLTDHGYIILCHYTN